MSRTRSSRISSRHCGSIFEALEHRQMMSVAEPNNTFAQAAVDSSNIYGEVQYAASDSVSPGDTDDFFKFYNLYGSSHLYASLYGLSADADLYVYDQNYNVLASSKNTANFSELLKDVNLPA